MIQDPVAILVVLAGVVYTAIRLEQGHKVFRSLGAALVAILLGMVLSNSGLLPGTSPTYDLLMGPVVSVGIVLILFSVDLRTVISAGPVMLGAFAIGAVGTAIGAMVAGLAFAGMVGPETWKLTGQYTGTYTGGGVNFAALGEALDTSADLFSAAVAADVVLTAIWMAACLAVPVMLGYTGEGSDTPPAAAAAGTGEDDTATSAPAASDSSTPDDEDASLHSRLYESRRNLGLADVAALVTLGVGVWWASEAVGEMFPILPSVLWLTTLSLVLAQVPAVKRLAGGAMLGHYLVLLFLASNGAQSVIANIFRIGPGVFYFALTTVAIHGLFIFGVGRLARIDAGTLAVASQANVGGVGSAVALASARGYSEKLLPGVATGLLGYAVGNYIGYAVAQVMRGVLGG
jgi:uncharacterized membrane protein